MKKMKYETPELEIIKFEAEDIITASGEGGNGNNSPEDDP